MGEGNDVATIVVMVTGMRIVTRRWKIQEFQKNMVWLSQQ